MLGEPRRAGLEARHVDYINLHGTASAVNDAIEDKAVTAVFGVETPLSSTKGWTGHTLGAAGVTEAAVACLCLERGLLPGCLNTVTVDPQLAGHVVLENQVQALNTVMSNSFGFGGSNCSLVFRRL